jgi:ABC-type molybdate transport system substrate-binding protein
MEKTILMVLISMRNENAVKVQSLLTEFGCLIKTRLGVHDASTDTCSNYGLLILELTGVKKDQDRLAKKLKQIKGIRVKLERLKVK